MQTLATYVTTLGAREVVLVEVPDQPATFTLLDVLVGHRGADADPRVIEHELRTTEEARALAADYVVRSARAAWPAVDYTPWDDEEDPDAALTPAA